LPYAIYNSYRRVLPRKRDTMVNPKDDVLYQKEEIVNNGELNFTEEGGEQ
jgi:adenine-specific DNA-methyltransferase